MTETRRPTPATKKIRRSPEQWQTIIASYEQSGLTQEAFCVRESLAMSTFYKWRQRLLEGQPHEPSQPMFVELNSQQQPTQHNQWDIELSLSNDIVLRLRQA